MREKCSIEIPNGYEIVGFDNETKQVIVECNSATPKLCSPTCSISIRGTNSQSSYKKNGMTYIAIKGHPTRGADVIRILKDFGAVNPEGLTGEDDCYYGLKDNKQRSWNCDIEADDYYEIAKWEQEPNPQEHLILTLEEFEDKIPYRRGDYFEHQLGGIYELVGYTTYKDKRICYRAREYGKELIEFCFPDYINLIVGTGWLLDYGGGVSLHNLRTHQPVCLSLCEGYKFEIIDGAVYISPNKTKI